MSSRMYVETSIPSSISSGDRNPGWWRGAHGPIGKRVEILVVEDDATTRAAEPRTGTAREQGALRERVLGSLRGRLEVPDDFDDPS